MSGPTARRASHRDRLSERVGGEWGPGIGRLSEAALLMDASGRDVILLEAVGVGSGRGGLPV